MFLPQFPWILADLQSVIAAVFMLIAFAGWVGNLINQSKAGAPQQRRPPQGRPAPGQKSVQSEIDKFLNQAREVSPPNPSRDERLSSDGVEVIERPRNAPTRRPPPTQQRRRTQREIWEEQIGKSAPEPPVPPAPRKQPAPSRKAEAPKPAPASGSSRPGGQITNRKAPTTFPAETSRSVGSPKDSRISSAVSKDLAPQIGTNVTAHLGSFQAISTTSFGESGIAATTAKSETPAAKLGQLIKSRHGMRDAILLSEILSKPRALRRNSQ
ncbi:hypothetical protein SH661x_003218 [Planctomicrobium sp. SH661]|uniref:hypothetical protein n=1 Tax=Planctomicrobium sp. SH661 TaxID=3448124 RepID=UPI003F5C0B65